MILKLYLKKNKIQKKTNNTISLNNNFGTKYVGKNNI